MNNLLKTILAILFVINYNNLFAQAPEKMSYQAIVRDASNNLLNSTSVGMRVSILQGSTSGNAVFVETHTPTSNTNGLVTIEIGNGTNVNGSFSNIDWANGPFFIKTETDPTGGTSYSLSGISQLLSVPYALYAKRSDTSLVTLDQYWSKTATNVHLNNGNVGIGTAITNPMNLLCLNPVAGTRDGIEFRDQNSSNFGMKILYNEPNNQLQIISNNNGTETDVMSFNRGTGNVGIGTNAPISLLSMSGLQPELTVEGTGSGVHQGALVLKSTQNSGPERGLGMFMFSKQESDEWFIGRPYNYDNFVIYRQANLTDHNVSSGALLTGSGPTPTLNFFNLTPNGNLGLGGTIFPNSRLQIKGGDVYVEDINNGVILKSPNGSCWRITVDNSGNLIRSAITCP